MAKRPYYLLLVRDDASAPWRIEFGDVDRECVEFELEDYVDHDHRRGNLKIVATGQTQRVITAAVNAINAKGRKVSA